MKNPKDSNEKCWNNRREFGVYQPHLFHSHQDLHILRQLSKHRDIGLRASSNTENFRHWFRFAAHRRLATAASRRLLDSMLNDFTSKMLHAKHRAWGGGIMFKNRAEATEMLAEKLGSYAGTHPLILGIPRGAVPMAKILAEKLHGDMDVVLVKKIGAPGDPECAIGSVSEYGTVHRSQGASFFPNEYVHSAAKEVLEKVKKRRQQYTGVHKAIDPRDRTIIVVDDGIATGSTMLAAVRAIKLQHPAKIVVATPVAPPDIIPMLEKEVDDLVVLSIPSNFYAVGQFYENFPQVEDEEVIKLLS